MDLYATWDRVLPFAMAVEKVLFNPLYPPISLLSLSDLIRQSRLLDHPVKPYDDTVNTPKTPSGDESPVPLAFLNGSCGQTHRSASTPGPSVEGHLFTVGLFSIDVELMLRYLHKAISDSRISL